MKTSQLKGTDNLRGMRLVCLGDSITGAPNLRMFLKYSFILDCMFEARLGPGAVEVVNRGIAGDTTLGALRRLRGDVLDLRPDIVTILLGGNDGCQHVDPSQTRANLVEIVRQIQTTGANILLMQYHCLPNPEQPETAWTLLQANNALIADVAAAEGVPCLDLAQPMSAACAGSATWELAGRDDATGIADWRLVPLTQEHLANKVDGVHLNPAGELVIARTVFAKLLDLGWIK